MLGIGMSYILALSVWVVLIASAALTEAQGQGDYVQQPVFYNFQGIPEGPQGQKYVALTFDDGPHQVLTPRLMDILQQHLYKKSRPLPPFKMAASAPQVAELLSTLRRAMNMNTAEDLDRWAELTHLLELKLFNVTKFPAQPLHPPLQPATKEQIDHMLHQLEDRLEANNTLHEFYAPWQRRLRRLLERTNASLLPLEERVMSLGHFSNC